MRHVSGRISHVVQIPNSGDPISCGVLCPFGGPDHGHAAELLKRRTIRAAIQSHCGLNASNESTRARVNEAYGKLPLSFEANRGQTNDRVKFLSRGSGYSLFLTSSDAVMAVSRNLSAGMDGLLYH
jgi:hypothetical protein